jgi:hypothetical protein
MSAPQITAKDLRRISGRLPDRPDQAPLPMAPPPPRRLGRQQESVLDGLRRKQLREESSKEVR